MTWDWQPIATAPTEPRAPFDPWLILGHDQKKWIRFGYYYPACKRWYYSGTSERTQWAQVMDDAPTHWLPMPAPPQEDPMP